MRQHIRVLIAIIAVLGLLGIGLAAGPGVALAQEDGADSDEDGVGPDGFNGSDTANESDAFATDSENESAADEDAEDDEDGGGGYREAIADRAPSVSTPSLPSAGDWIEDAIEWVIEDLREGAVEYIDGFHEVFVGFYTIGGGDDPSTWMDQEEGTISGAIIAFHYITLFLSLPVMAYSLFAILNVKDPVKKRRLFKMWLFSLAMIAGGRLLAPGTFHFASVFSTGFAPDGLEFMAEDGGLEALAFGHILGGLLAIAQPAIVVLGGLIQAGVYVLPLVFVAFWNLMWSMKTVPLKVCQSFANVLIAGMGLFIAIRLFQGLLLRLAFMIPMDSILSMLLVAFILFVALIGIIIWGYKNVQFSSAMALSDLSVRNRYAYTGHHRGNGAVQKAAQPINQARNKVATRARAVADGGRQRAVNGVRSGASRARDRVGNSVGSGSGSGSNSSSAGSRTQSTPNTQSNASGGKSTTSETTRTGSGSNSAQRITPNRSRSVPKKPTITQQRVNAKKRVEHSRTKNRDRSTGFRGTKKYRQSGNSFSEVKKD
jgi:hypothetical protein